MLAVIINRIQGAVDSGELRPVTENTAFLPIATMRDLLRPWEECFPGVELPDQDEDSADFRSSRRSMSRLRRPRFLSQPRRSARPIPAPRRLAPGPTLVHPGLFKSISAIWDYYQKKNEAAAELMEQPFDQEGMSKFLDPLYNVLSDYYPLYCEIEMIGSEPVQEMHGISMRLPCWSYQDEDSGAAEAFMSGAEGIEWLMAHYSKSQEWDLPKADRKLLEDVPWGELALTYLHPGKKTYDLHQFYDLESSFFAEVKAKYPAQYGQGKAIISDDYGDEVQIACAEDIEFALAYSEAFEKLRYAMPDTEAFEENAKRITERFAHELCNVWRRVKGKRQVKWEPIVESGRVRV